MFFELYNNYYFLLFNGFGLLLIVFVINYDWDFCDSMTISMYTTKNHKFCLSQETHTNYVYKVKVYIISLMGFKHIYLQLFQCLGDMFWCGKATYPLELCTVIVIWCGSKSACLIPWNKRDAKQDTVVLWVYAPV